MRFRRALVRRVAVLAVAGSLFVGVLPVATAQAMTSPGIRSAIETKINKARERRGLRRLRVSTYVCPAAMTRTTCMQSFAANHAKKMAMVGEIFHDSATRLWAEVPKIAWWRAENVGYVSQGTAPAYRMHRAFMRSDGHRANILKRRATHMGIGVYQTRRRVYVVERFVDVWPLPL